MTLYLALGSNLGDRLDNLRFARSAIESIILTSPAQSARLYETEPVDCPPGSPPFLNTVVGGETELPPREVLAQTQAIERAAGRQPGASRNAPRPLDVDVLLLDDLVFADEALLLPHPRIQERFFVLEPLHDLAADLQVPGLGRRISELRAALAETKAPPSVYASSW